SSPSANHLKNGGLESSSAWVGSRYQLRPDSARDIQNPTGSASASAYSDSSDTRARSRNAAGGGNTRRSSSRASMACLCPSMSTPPLETVGASPDDSQAAQAPSERGVAPQDGYPSAV